MLTEIFIFINKLQFCFESALICPVQGSVMRKYAEK